MAIDKPALTHQACRPRHQRDSESAPLFTLLTTRCQQGVAIITVT